jgi:hypothetical protein
MNQTKMRPVRRNGQPRNAGLELIRLAELLSLFEFVGDGPGLFDRGLDPIGHLFAECLTPVFVFGTTGAKHEGNE